MEHYFKSSSHSHALKEILEKHKRFSAPSIAESFGLTGELAQEILNVDLSGAVNSTVEEMTNYNPFENFQAYTVYEIDVDERNDKLGED